jgi:hypothetical protein
MPRINTPDTGHVGPATLSDGIAFLPFTDPHYLAVLRSAILIIDGNLRGHSPCDAAFRALPGGRSFAQVWYDPSVWINFDPSLDPRDFGATREGTKESTISANALKRGRWTVAATLVHELAYVNGARFGHSLEAETALQTCFLPELKDPNMWGQLSQRGRVRGPTSTES